MKQFSQKTKIWIAVALIHSIFIIFLSTAVVSKKPAKKKLVIVTKNLVPNTIMQKQVTATSITKAENLVKNPSPLKKSALPCKAKPAPKPAPKPATKPASKPIPKSSKQVLKKIDQRLTKQPLKQVIAEKEPTYLELASSIFQNTLVLPENGPVKLTITVLPNGKISNLEVETFESKKNSDYLLAILPTLCLPFPEGGKATTFTVLFCSD